MPMQQQNSNFAARLGGQLSAANAECRGKPLDLGQRRLPGGIKNGIAKLQTMYTKVSDNDNGVAPKGCDFFRASAVVVSPVMHGNEKIAGMITSYMVPLCATPEKVGDGYKKDAVPFIVNWNKFRSLFSALGIQEPNETQQSDPDGTKVMNYYFAAMKALTDPARKPVFISFSTRSWKRKKKIGETDEQYAKVEENVTEEWHGLASPQAVATMNESHSPAAGFREAPPTAPPPNGKPAVQENTEVDEPFNEFASEGEELQAEVESLVEIATNDPQGETEEGQQAAKRLEELAWANGWTGQQTTDAQDWTEVGNMALNPPEVPANEIGNVGIGSKWKYHKRDSNGKKLTSNKSGKEFPPHEVEVVTVDLANGTCTVKTVKDDKVVMDIRGKKPVQVKWEWLE